MDSKNRTYLECERQWVFALLIFVGGFYGSYTYLLRGGVFCNAQTANFVLFAIELGNFRWARAAYYLIPMTAYMMGAFVSEAISLKLTRVKFLRWETILVGIEILFIAALGFVPDSAPFQISQVAINFICSMQYNTFRQAEGVPMATTFCTNHVRQVGIHLYHFLSKKDSPFLRRSLCSAATPLRDEPSGLPRCRCCFCSSTCCGPTSPPKRTCSTPCRAGTSQLNHKQKREASASLSLFL